MVEAGRGAIFFCFPTMQILVKVYELHKPVWYFHPGASISFSGLGW